ncbi:MAG: hypothetical protein PVG45_06815 [Gammaproteobacteria bacterium]|jgi:hypothetical protein
MKSKHAWFKGVVLSIPLLLGSAGAMAFPDIPFCPLGGPPGWLDRIFDDDDHHRYHPPPYYRPPPAAAPYWNQGGFYPYTPRHYPYPVPPVR